MAPEAIALAIIWLTETWGYIAGSRVLCMQPKAT